MSEDQKRLLETKLWDIANTLRGKMDADEFKDYVLGFIFYKYLSEKMHLYADNILKPDGILYADLDENSPDGMEILEAVRENALEALGFFLKPSELFSGLARKGNSIFTDNSSAFILEDLQRILKHIEDSTLGTESEDDFNSLFEDMDLNSTKLGKSPDDRNKVIARIMLSLDQIDFKLQETEADVLGDAYEYLIGQFASGAGKKAGEFYTPQQVSKILAKIVTTGKTQLKSVYDPTCGSGSLLLRVAREVQVANFYGQELNRTTYNLARMNMLLHGVHYRNFDIRLEDTLERPQHQDFKFEAVVANPPFSAKWSANPHFMTDDRFSQAGKLPPSSKADYAFVQHMVHHLDDNGVMAVVFPHGALFRGAAEGHIRRFLIEDKNYLDAVIGLPPNIFYGTGIPTCILVFKKCRENPDDILFIDASRHFEKVKTQNFIRDEDVERIIETYRARNTVEKFSYRAPVSEIVENEYNLNIPRYVKTEEEEEEIDLTATARELADLEAEISRVDETIALFCDELGISRPV